MIILGVIPARLHSSRLPRKVLREIRGVPMVVHVFRQARTSSLLSDVLVATDSEEVVETCHAHHVPAVMTRADHAVGHRPAVGGVAGARAPTSTSTSRATSH